MPTTKKRIQKKKKPSLRDETAKKVPSLTDWRTTDEDERNRRLLRALDEKPRVVNLTPEHPAYSNFKVHSPSGLSYEVEIRSIEPRLCHCDCTDFRINGLGTCKHVEAVIQYLQGKLRKRRFAETVTQGSPRIDVIPDPERQSLQVHTQRRLSGALQRLFDSNLQLFESVSMDEALETLARCRVHGLRVSKEIAPWQLQQRKLAERQALRREYEQKVQAGHYPAHETKVPLYPYQREGMLHLAFTGRAMIADEMGLGKTIQAIAACALLHRLGKAQRALIVAPASLKTEWEEQINQFTHLSYQIVYGPKAKRLRDYRDHDPFFTLTNYEQIRPDALDINEYLKPDIVVLDEAQRIKNWSTQTARAVKRLQSPYAFVLTGTPIENRIDELYSIVDFLDPSLLGPLFRFNRDYYQFDERGRPCDYQNLGKLHERVKPVMLRRLKRDVETELPERTDRTHFVEMSPSQLDSYRYHEEIVGRLAAMARKRPLRKEEQERLMRELAMMRMVCDTCYILDSKDRACPKLDELEKVLDEYLVQDDVKIIIFSEWVRMLELVRDLLQELSLSYAWHTGSVPQQKRREEIRAFKEDPNCRVFLCSESGGVGLNLQNASVVINCDLPWNPAKLEQRIARAWRKHQTRPVTVIHLVSRHTIEHGMLGTLAAKRELAQGVLDMEGDLDEITMKRGSQAFVDKLEQVLTTAATLKKDSAKPARPKVPSDPCLAFGQGCLGDLGDNLMRAEEHFPQSDDLSNTFVVVVNDLTANAEQQVRTHFERSLGDQHEESALQIMDRATADAIAQLQKAGVIQMTTRAVRPLTVMPGSEPDATPAYTDEQRQRMAELSELTGKKLKMAKLLDGGGFSEEAREPLLHSVLEVARLRAIHDHLTEPKTLSDVLQTPFDTVWLKERSIIDRFIANETEKPAAVVKVIERLLQVDLAS